MFLSLQLKLWKADLNKWIHFIFLFFYTFFARKNKSLMAKMNISAEPIAHIHYNSTNKENAHLLSSPIWICCID